MIDGTQIIFSEKEINIGHEKAPSVEPVGLQKHND
jgi:hypothetical protein